MIHLSIDDFKSPLALSLLQKLGRIFELCKFAIKQQKLGTKFKCTGKENILFETTIVSIAVVFFWGRVGVGKQFGL